jgi:hypothetical protein
MTKALIRKGVVKGSNNGCGQVKKTMEMLEDCVKHITKHAKQQDDGNALKQKGPSLCSKGTWYGMHGTKVPCGWGC